MTTPNPTPDAASQSGAAASAAQPSTPAEPVRPGGGPWPGERQWTDEDYKRFVELYAIGAFPELYDNPIAWDEHYRCCADKYCYQGRYCRGGVMPQCPRHISPDDYRDHVTDYRENHGMLVLKLWAVAKGKGFTAEFDERCRQHQEEIERQKKEEQRQQVRQEVETLRQNLPSPRPVKMLSPRQLWYGQVMKSVPPETPLVDKVKHVQARVMEGQPYRSALLDDAPTETSNETFGPLTFDDSPDAISDPFEPEDEEEPQPVLRKWAADATTEEILNGSARDLSDLICVLIARQKSAIGYASDNDSINQAIRLSRTLCNLTQAVRTTQIMNQASRRGRPRKNRPRPLAKTTAAGPQPAPDLDD